MLTHRAIRREYDEAGSVNALLALWAFVDDATFVTKAGDVGVVYRLQGQDYEGLDHAQRRHVVHRFEAALRLLGERSRVYQVLLQASGSADYGGRLRVARHRPGRAGAGRPSQREGRRAVRNGDSSSC